MDIRRKKLLSDQRVDEVAMEGTCEVPFLRLGLPLMLLIGQGRCWIPFVSTTFRSAISPGKRLRQFFHGQHNVR